MIVVYVFAATSSVEESASNQSGVGREMNKQLKRLKAAMWSLSWLCSRDNGCKLLAKLNQNKYIFINLFEFVGWLTKIAEEHACLSIRATGLYCLDLVGKSCTGSALLAQLGWLTVKEERQADLATPFIFSFSNTLNNNNNNNNNSSNDNSSSSNTSNNKISGLVDGPLSLVASIAICNINRCKSLVTLRTITCPERDTHSLMAVNYWSSVCKPHGTFSSYERDKLADQTTIDLININSFELMRTATARASPAAAAAAYANNKRVVPIRTSMWSAESDQQQQQLNATSASSTTTTTTASATAAESILFKNKCEQSACFSCFLSRQSDAANSTPATTTTMSSNKTKLEIIQLIGQLVPAINLDVKLARLECLRREHTSDFDMCLHALIARKFLDKHKLNHALRKFVQELFADMALASRNSFLY